MDDDAAATLLGDYVTPPRGSTGDQEPAKTVLKPVEIPESQTTVIVSSTATPQLDTLASTAAGELQKLIDEGKVPGVAAGTPLKALVAIPATSSTGK